MSSTTRTTPNTARNSTTSRATSDPTWLRIVQVSIALVIPAMIVLAVVMMFFTTVSKGDFHYAADYWLTAAGLPLTLGGIGIAVGVHRLQHGADGRLGTIGMWIVVLALTELFAQLLASVIDGAEIRWGPAYPVCALLSFVGLALLAAGSWRTGLLPKWMLGVWPFVWLIGGLASFGPTPLLLVAFLALLGIVLTRRVNARRKEIVVVMTSPAVGDESR
jgi:hypothetical protein